MPNLLKQIDFDSLAVDYLHAISARVNSKNLTTTQRIFKNDIDLLLDAVISVDEARTINNPEIENIRKIRRYKNKAA